jgi:hypothetical protein
MPANPEREPSRLAAMHKCNRISAINRSVAIQILYFRMLSVAGLRAQLRVPLNGQSV